MRNSKLFFIMLFSYGVFGAGSHCLSQESSAALRDREALISESEGLDQSKPALKTLVHPLVQIAKWGPGTTSEGAFFICDQSLVVPNSLQGQFQAEEGLRLELHEENLALFGFKSVDSADQEKPDKLSFSFVDIAQKNCVRWKKTGPGKFELNYFYSVFEAALGIPLSARRIGFHATLEFLSSNKLKFDLYTYKLEQAAWLPLFNSMDTQAVFFRN